jgi:uncharacterized membrane protein (DUF2068 family)
LNNEKGKGLMSNKWWGKLSYSKKYCLKYYIFLPIAFYGIAVIMALIAAPLAFLALVFVLYMGIRLREEKCPKCGKGFKFFILPKTCRNCGVDFSDV